MLAVPAIRGRIIRDVQRPTGQAVRERLVPAEQPVHLVGRGRQQASVRAGHPVGGVDRVDQPDQVALARQGVNPDPGRPALVLGPAIEQGIDLRVDVLDAPACLVAGHIHVQDEHRRALRVGQGHVLAARQRTGAHPVQLGPGLTGLWVFDPGGGEIPGRTALQHAPAKVGEQ